MKRAFPRVKQSDRYRPSHFNVLTSRVGPNPVSVTVPVARKRTAVPKYSDIQDLGAFDLPIISVTVQGWVCSTLALHGASVPTSRNTPEIDCCEPIGQFAPSTGVAKAMIAADGTAAATMKTSDACLMRFPRQGNDLSGHAEMHSIDNEYSTFST